MSADPRSERAIGAGAEWLPWFASATVVVAAIELTLLRLFTRTIVHIPGASDLSPILSVVSSVGRFSYYLATVLLIVLLVLLVGAFWRARDLMGAGAVLAFLVAAALARAGVVGDLSLALLVCGCVAATAIAAVGAGGGRDRVPVVLFVAGFLLAGSYAVLQSPVAADLRATRVLSPVLVGAEALALSAALASLLLLTHRPARRVIGAGVAVGVVACGALVANPSTTKVLLLWSFGLAGYFPSLVYAVAFGALAVTIIGLVREQRTAAAIAIALVAMGGIGLHSTYQSALVVAGLGLLALTFRASAPPVVAATRAQPLDRAQRSAPAERLPAGAAAGPGSTASA